MVLGVHRSGTSAATRVLSLLGAELPRRLMPPDPLNNDLGFWEPSQLVELNDEILASAGSSWDDVSPFPESWFETERARALRSQAMAEMRKDYGDSGLIVLKDPRICRLVPFWREVLAAFSAEPLFVVPFRNPLEVAGSLEARDGFTTAKSLLLWLRDVLSSERATRGFERSFVSYRGLLDDWRGTCARVGRQLGIDWPRGVGDVEGEIDGFLSDRLHRQRASAEQLEDREDVVHWVKEAYRALVERAEEAPGELAEPFDRISSELETSDLAFAPMVAERAAEAAIAQRHVDSLVGRLAAAASDETRSLRAEVIAVVEELATLKEGRHDGAGEIAHLRRELAARAERLAALEGRLEESVARMAHLEGRVEELIEHGVEAEVKERRELYDLLQAKAGELAATQAMFAARNDELHVLRAQVTQMLGSRSWRLTAPLRRLLASLRQVP